jgi:hypothetical protein
MQSARERDDCRSSSLFLTSMRPLILSRSV